MTQNVSGLCDDLITKCDSYYKMRRLLQIATVQLMRSPSLSKKLSFLQIKSSNRLRLSHSISEKTFSEKRIHFHKLYNTIFALVRLKHMSCLNIVISIPWQYEFF